MGPKARRQCAFDVVRRGASRRQRRIRNRAAFVGARDVYTWVVGTTTDDSNEARVCGWRDGGDQPLGVDMCYVVRTELGW